jgi:hypothetical protein
MEALRAEMNGVIIRLQKYLKIFRFISPTIERRWRQMRLWKCMIDLGLDPSTRNAPLALLFTADDRERESEVDAAILSYPMLISVEILGLKSCYFGALKNMLPYSTKLRRLLNLGPHRILVCGLLFGYSRLKYYRLVSRKRLKIIRCGKPATNGEE